MIRRLIVTVLFGFPTLGLFCLVAGSLAGLHAYYQATKNKDFIKVDPKITHLKALQDLVLIEHRYDDAFSCWEHIVEEKNIQNAKIENSENNAALGLAEAFANRNQKYYAIRVFRDIVRDARFPSNQGVYAHWLIRWGDYETALDILEEVRLTDPNYKICDYDFYMRILEKVNRVEKAIEIGNMGLEQKSNYAGEYEYQNLERYLNELEMKLASQQTVIH